jgi:hypothetical protein
MILHRRDLADRQLTHSGLLLRRSDRERPEPRLRKQGLLLGGAGLAGAVLWQAVISATAAVALTTFVTSDTIFIVASSDCLCGLVA